MAYSHEWYMKNRVRILKQQKAYQKKKRDEMRQTPKKFNESDYVKKSDLKALPDSLAVLTFVGLGLYILWNYLIITREFNIGILFTIAVMYLIITNK
jgi:hypothetical protein